MQSLVSGQGGRAWRTRTFVKLRGTALIGIRALALVLALSLAGCGDGSSPPAQTVSAPVAVRVGAHAVRFGVPDGWQRLDQGPVQVLRNDGAQLELQDLGTLSRLGMARRVERAQELHAAGQLLAARKELERLPYLQAAFLDAEAWLQVEDAWSLLVQRQDRAAPGEVDRAYAHVLEMLYQQRDWALAPVAEMILRLEDRNGQRELSRAEVLTIDDREAVLCETRDRLSHGMPQRHLFVRDGDRVLRLSTRYGAPERVAATFDQIAGSLSFVSSAAP